jgi:PIN domain nuclease of toxin-antitoxin system
LKVLLDTHIAVWSMIDQPRLSSSARKTIADASTVVVSAATVWEVSIKAALGKLDIDVNDLVATLDASGAEQLPVTWSHAIAVRSLPLFHRDPFDRLLVAQAEREGLQLITHDGLLARYGSFVRVV